MLYIHTSLICALALCISVCPSAFTQAVLAPESQIKDKLSEEMATHIELDYHDRRTAWFADQALEKVVRDNPFLAKLTVSGYGYLMNWTLLEAGISAIKSLDSLHWESHAVIPSTILWILETHKPDCKLFYTIPFTLDYKDDEEDDEVPFAQPTGQEHNRESHFLKLNCILNSTILYALRADITYGSEENMENMALVQRILETCPNLRELELSVRWCGCVVGYFQPYSFDFTKPARLFPSLSAINLDGYRLLDKVDCNQKMESERAFPLESRFNWPWNKLPELVLYFISIDGFHKIGGVRADYWERRQHMATENSISNLDAWLERMDWSNLKRLELDSLDLSVMQKLTPVLKNLSSIRIGHGGRGASVELLRFLRTTKEPLEAISFQRIAFGGYDELVSVIATQHGTSLKSLSLCNLAGCWAGYLKVSHALELRDNCAKLDALVVDSERLLRPGKPVIYEFDYQFIDAVASIPGLSRLQLRFEPWILPRRRIVRNGENEVDREDYDYREDCKDLGVTDPLVNQSSVEGLFERVRNVRKKSGLRDLKLLDIVVGNWENRYGPFISGSTDRLLGKWECRGDGCLGGNEYYGVGTERLAQPYFTQGWCVLNPDEEEDGIEEDLLDAERF